MMEAVYTFGTAIAVLVFACISVTIFVHWIFPEPTVWKDDDWDTDY